MSDDELEGMSWVGALQHGSYPPLGQHDSAPDRWLGPALERRVRAATGADERAALHASLDYLEQRDTRPLILTSSLVGTMALSLSALAVALSFVVIEDRWYRLGLTIYLSLFVVLALGTWTLERQRTREARRTLCVTAEVRRVLADVDARAQSDASRQGLLRRWLMRRR